MEKIKCEFKPKKINNNYHSISLENHSYNRILYMKKEIDDGNVTQLKLKNPFYRLDYLKEYAFIHKEKDNIL